MEDKSEEILEVLVGQRLVSDHEAALPDHPLLDPGRDLLQPPPPVLGLLLAPEAGRDVPEVVLEIVPSEGS